MKTFIEYITESYINLSMDDEKKKTYANQVFDILQKSYAKIGGIHGSGFSSPEDMIQNIPYWKLFKRNDKIIACVLYKDRSGRKLVALGSDGSSEGKNIAKRMLRDDIERNRAYGEVSDAVLRYLQNTYGDELDKFLIPAKEAGKILNKEVTPTGIYTYRRLIGGVEHEKAMYGSLGKGFKS